MENIVILIRRNLGKFLFLLSIVCACIIFLFPPINTWNFRKTSVGTGELSGQQAGVNLFLWKNAKSKRSGLKITAPSKLEALFNNEVSWAGIQTMKPTCRKFDILAYTEKISSGVGEGSLSLKVSGNSLVQCGPRHQNASNAIAAILGQDSNLQIFGPSGKRLAKWTISKKDQQYIKAYLECGT